MIRKLLCAAGFHSWSPWIWITARNPLDDELRRTCKACATVQRVPSIT